MGAAADGLLGEQLVERLLEAAFGGGLVAHKQGGAWRGERVGQGAGGGVEAGVELEGVAQVVGGLTIVGEQGM